VSGAWTHAVTLIQLIIHCGIHAWMRFIKRWRLLNSGEAVEVLTGKV
jgi:hypothetical protein